MARVEERSVLAAVAYFATQRNLAVCGKVLIVPGSTSGTKISLVKQVSSFAERECAETSALGDAVAVEFM